VGKQYVRKINRKLIDRLHESRRFIQVLYGPRQVGKTTAIRQVLDGIKLPSHYVSADQPALRDLEWLEEQWELARHLARKSRRAVLVIDEVQKVGHWSELVKRLWDEDTFTGVPLHVVLLGSSPLLIQAGLTESLAGRFEVIRAGHWSYRECHEYFGWDADTFIYYGGYPGAAPLIGDRERWRSYLQESLIETAVSRDILLMTRVDKPALLRRLFHLGCQYSGQVLSYQKMLGQLQDAGNTTTLAHYLELLTGAGFLAGLAKFSGRAVRRRGSSPKFQVFDTALISAQSDLDFNQARSDGEFWGHLVESAIGAHLLNLSAEAGLGLFYWREGSREVDFVITRSRKIIAIEVKSGRSKGSVSGMAAFSKANSPSRKLLVGSGGIPVSEFLGWDQDSL